MLTRMKKEKVLEDWQIADAENLRRLFDARLETTAEGRLISQMEFGAKYGIGSQGMVWQYLKGRRPLNIKAAVAFARGLGVKVSDFSAGLAAQIEDASDVERDSPAVRLLVPEPQQHLQWVSDEEARLLDSFRSCARGERAQALVFVDSLPKVAIPAGQVRSKA
jgi:hypothetical protein